MVIIVGVFIIAVDRQGYGVIGFGYLISPYWKKTHPDINEDVASREKQRKTISWRKNLKRKIN